MLNKGLGVLEIKQKESKDIFIIIKGSIIALVLTILMLTIYAAVLSFTNVSENSMMVVIMAIVGICIFAGSFLANLKIKRKGIINGAFIGLIYIVSVYIVSSIVTGIFNLNINSIIMIIVSMLTGIIGGVIGVNIKWFYYTKL